MAMMGPMGMKGIKGMPCMKGAMGCHPMGCMGAPMGCVPPGVAGQAGMAMGDMCDPAAKGGAAGVKGRKTQICSYWKENRCSRGALCSYAHGEHELEPEVRARVPAQPPKMRTILTPTVVTPVKLDPKFVSNRKTQ